jgi:hypothetical protein
MAIGNSAESGTRPVLPGTWYDCGFSLARAARFQPVVRGSAFTACEPRRQASLPRNVLGA